MYEAAYVDSGLEKRQFEQRLLPIADSRFNVILILTNIIMLLPSLFQ